MYPVVTGALTKNSIVAIMVISSVDNNIQTDGAQTCLRSTWCTRWMDGRGRSFGFRFFGAFFNHRLIMLKTTNTWTGVHLNTWTGVQVFVRFVCGHPGCAIPLCVCVVEIQCSCVFCTNQLIVFAANLGPILRRSQAIRSLTCQLQNRYQLTYY